MEVDSTSGREAAVIALAERILGERGWQTRRIRVTQGRDDLLATTSHEPTVVLSTHLDTVPPFIPPKLSGDRILGRGACDAKGIAAARMCAAERLRDRGVGVALLFVVGEENTHDGAAAANREPLRTRVLINGEPTESTLALGTKGAMRFVIRTGGKAAHSAYPELGESATAKLVKILAEVPALQLPTDPVLGATTVNIGRLAGGVADNVTAPDAEARMMARIVRPLDEMAALFRRWIGDRAQIEFGEAVPAVHLTGLPGFATSVVAYATDVPNLDRWGQPYLFGPGSIHVAHTDDEFISIAELRAAVGAYEKLAVTALSHVS